MAFHMCDALFEVENGYTYVDNWLISCDTSKTAITGVRKGTVGIAASAFKDCSAVTTVELPASIQYVGSIAFYDCKNITSATVPAAAVSEINKTQLKTLVIISGEVLGSFDLLGANQLERITLPKTITEIEGGALFACESLKDIYYEGTESEWADVKKSNWEYSKLVIHFSEA